MVLMNQATDNFPDVPILTKCILEEPAAQLRKAYKYASNFNSKAYQHLPDFLQEAKLLEHLNRSLLLCIK